MLYFLEIFKRLACRWVWLLLAGLFLVVWGFWAWRADPGPKQVYEAAVFAHDQAGDERTSHRRGDVLAIHNEGHGWSPTERVSFLILKIELTEEQKQKLVMPDTREIPRRQWSEEERAREEAEKERARAEGREYRAEPRLETLRPRLYRIRLEDKVFAGFSREQLMEGRPFMGRVFGWGIVDKK